MKALTYPDKGIPCDHDIVARFALGCEQHEYKHVVGYVCYICDNQWYVEDDWRTEECRNCDKQ